MSEPGWFLGVDGGATRCRARLRDAKGVRLADADGPAANTYVNFEAAIGAVATVIEKALRRAGLEGRKGEVALGIGLAGLSTDEEIDSVERRFPGFARTKAANDAMIACLGAHAGRDGAIIIAGTGTAAMARVGGRDMIFGGRGFIVGDDGSGARVGADALRAAVLAADELGPASPLTDALLARYGGDVVRIVEWAATAKPGDFGALAPLVLEHAAKGDAIARGIVADAVVAIAALAAGARARGAKDVALVSGLSTALRPFMAPELEAALMRPLHEAVDGAILLAGGPAPAEETTP